VRINLVPGKPIGTKWVWCGLCAEHVKRESIRAHEKTHTHADLYARFSRQEALDKVIPFEYDDRHYGLMESDAARLGL
jgi:hypothetical protein